MLSVPHGSYISTIALSLPYDPNVIQGMKISLHCTHLSAILPIDINIPLFFSVRNPQKFSFLFSSLCNREMQEQATSSIAANSLPSSSERSSSSALQLEVKEGMESDDEIRRVPEIGSEPAGTSASGRDGGSVAGAGRAQAPGEGQSQRKRGRSPADKENKRLKRLLRNRVSAQQARERKKAYLNELETRVKDLEKKNSELEERLSTLQNENQMLRQILKNTTASRRGGSSNGSGDGSL